jgi:peptidoglycan/LPS O-acetylase OafA/YrhL
MQQDYYRLGYRPDIEGLRAVAVLLVILCHARVPGFSGGFIGVDVFFVLSGYLISGLLIKEFSSQGSIAFTRFYLRRLQRLAPALLAMLLATSVIVYLTISPHAQSAHFMSAAAAALWMSNIHFAVGELNYFAPNAAENVFLHTWSLSVEEQFYLLWPGLIFLVLGTRRSGNAYTRIWRLGPALLLIVLTSFAVCFYLTYNNAVAAYYFPTSRAWQFAIGALALLFTFRQRNDFAGISQTSRTGSPGTSVVAGWIGFGALAFAATTLTETSRYPGMWALLPSLGTALILSAGTAPQRWGLSRVLAIKPLVLIGSVSYSWYLWHWPVLVLGRVLKPDSSPYSTAAAIGLSLILAVLSYYLIETPIRRNQFLRSKPRFFGITTLAAMVLIVMWQLWLTQRSQTQIFSPELEQYYAARNDLPVIYEMECDSWADSSDLKRCEFGSGTPEHEAMLIGDSVAAQWFSAFSGIAAWPDWRLTVLTKSSCPIVDNPFFYTRIGRRFQECETWRDNVLVEISKMHPDLVIISSASSYPFSATEWKQGTSRILQEISNHAEHVIVLRATPILPFDALDCLGNQAWQEKEAPFMPAPDCSTIGGNYFGGEYVYDALQAASLPFGNVQVVDLNSLVCPGGVCDATYGEFIVFRDKQHLTDKFVKTITPRILALTAIESLRKQKE